MKSAYGELGEKSVIPRFCDLPEGICFREQSGRPSQYCVHVVNCISTDEFAVG